MARRSSATTYGRLATLFAVAFAILSAILALLGYFGLPANVLGSVLGGAVLLAFGAIGISAATMQTSEFYLAARALPPPVNGIASAAAVISGTLFLGLAGSYFADANAAVAITIGWCLGFVVLAVCFAPYFRKSGAFGVVDFLGVRYGGRAVRLAAALVVGLALFAATAAAMVSAATLTALLLGISAGTTVAVVTALIVVTAVFGGVRAITRTAMVEYIVLAAAFLVPVTIVAIREYASPLPQLTFGFALRDAALLVLASGRDLAPPPTGQSWATAGGGVFTFLATVLTLAAGVASLPHLLMRSATVRGPDRARRSAAWGLLFVLLIIAAAPAYAAFAHFLILREVVDGPIENLPDWIFTFGNLGLIRICGVEAVSVDAVLGACSGAAGFTGNLAASDLSMSGDGLVLAAPAIFDLPAVASALVALGALAATLAAAKAMAFAVASAIGHDLYGSAREVHPSPGRQLIVTRVLLVAIVLLAAWLASDAPDVAFALAPAAISLSAGALFPALILAVWWKRATANGAVAGILTGLVVTGGLILDRRYPGFLPFGRLGFSELTAAIVGMPLGFLAAIGVSLASEPPAEERQGIVDAIRRPGGAPFVQESESL
jgi:cation/acetate symporter